MSSGSLRTVTPLNVGEVFERFPGFGIVPLVRAALSLRPAAALGEEIRQVEVASDEIGLPPGSRKLAVMTHDDEANDDELVELVAIPSDVVAADNGMGC